MTPKTLLLLGGLLLVPLYGCNENTAAEPPAPVAMTEDALGHYCQMALSEHPGPKAQVHLEGMDAPLFFSQVRDAVAYQRMPEQTHRILAIYVSDMTAAPSWENPGIDNWIAASAAYFVVGSKMGGGMGAPELIPFSAMADAYAHAARHGGQVLRLEEIGDGDVLAPVEFATDADGDFVPPHTAMEH